MNYLITYSDYDHEGNLFKHGKIKVKNKPNMMSAKVGLDNYFVKHFTEFKTLVIDQCVEAPLETDEFMKMWDQMFGGSAT